MRIGLWAFTGLLGFSTLCVGAPPDPKGAEHCSSKARVPIEITHDVIFFQVQVKGSHRSLWFNLDSGSGATYLDRALAASLGLHATGSGSVHGAGSGAVPVQYLDSVTFELAGFESANHRVNVTDLGGLGEQFGRAEDGFFGYDFLSRYVVVVDYLARTMSICDPATFRYSGRGSAFPVRFRGRWPYIAGTIKVQGLAPQSGDFLVDSGSGDAVDHPAILKSTAPLRKIRTGVGLGTPGEGALGRAEYFELGSYRLKGPVTSCCSANPDDQQKIGGEVLRRFTVIFDYPHRRIILEPNRNLTEPFPDA